ncbi:MAG TPA: Flp family type IVb pilin [Pirellulales bacterium]|jgi:pilus assembly protein Flp/PilA
MSAARNSRFLKAAGRFLASEDGPAAVEYALMLALIVLICITAIQSIGTNANTQFGKVATKLGSLRISKLSTWRRHWLFLAALSPACCRRAIVRTN